MGERFGYDFSRVRVHSDTAAQQSAHDVQAKAYTVGQNVVFGSGQYSPSTNQGQRLIAHELTHVVQQAGQPASVQRWFSDHLTATPTPELPGAQALEEKRYNLELVVPKILLTHAKTYTSSGVTASEAIEVLYTFRQKLVDIVDEHKLLHRELRDNREEHSTVGYWSDAFGGVDLPDYEMWESPKSTLYQSRLLLDKAKQVKPEGSTTAMGARDPHGQIHTVPEQAAMLLQLAADEIGEMDAVLMEYKDGTEKGAERGITVCKVTIAVLGAAAGGAASQGIKGITVLASSPFWSGAVLATGTTVITAEAAEVGSQVGEMRYGKRDWFHFDWARIGKVGLKSAVEGFVGAITGGAFGKVIGRFGKFLGPKLAKWGGVFDSKAIKMLGSMGENWLTTAGSTPFTTVSGALMDKALGDSQFNSWEQFYDQILSDMWEGELMGTFLHGAGLAFPSPHGAPGRLSEISHRDGLGSTQGDAGFEPVNAGKDGETMSGDSRSAEVDANTPDKPFVSDTAVDPPADFISKEDAIAVEPIPEGDGHEAVVTEEGVGPCSPSPCPNIGVEFAEELRGDRRNQARNRRVQELRVSDPKLAAKKAAELIHDLRAKRIKNLNDGRNRAAAQIEDNGNNTSRDEARNVLERRGGRNATDRAYRLIGDFLQLAGSTTGFQVYEFRGTDGELLYVGKSGGGGDSLNKTGPFTVGRAEGRANNWLNRLSDSHIRTRWIWEANTVTVTSELTWPEAYALEGSLIPDARYNKEAGELHDPVAAVDAKKKPRVHYAIDALPSRFFDAPVATADIEYIDKNGLSDDLGLKRERGADSSRYGAIDNESMFERALGYAGRSRWRVKP